MLKVNGIRVSVDCYPNNERIFKSVKVARGSPIVFDMTYELDFDISALMMYSQWAKDKFPEEKTQLIMRYIPYSRMDREIEGYIFSLKYFCKMVNALNFDKVYVLDPHSYVSISLLDRCEEISIQTYIDRVINVEKPDFIFYPDAGAMKRYSEHLKIPSNIGLIYGSKQRNLQTGEIEKFSVNGVSDLTGKSVLIIDDLCSYGGTFFGAAQQLIAMGTSVVNLYVTHCEMSIYNGQLLKKDSGVSKIYTTDSLLRNWESNKIINIMEVV